jgi:hypothetical protein
LIIPAIERIYLFGAVCALLLQIRAFLENSHGGFQGGKTMGGVKSNIIPELQMEKPYVL